MYQLIQHNMLNRRRSASSRSLKFQLRRDHYVSQAQLPFLKTESINQGFKCHLQSAAHSNGCMPWALTIYKTLDLISEIMFDSD